MEKRRYERFAPYGSTVRVKRWGVLSRLAGFSETLFPVLDLSQGGMRFSSSRKFYPNQRIVMRFASPGLVPAIHLYGHVKWVGANPDPDHAYQVGVGFFPFGRYKGMNVPRNLARIAMVKKLEEPKS